MPTGNRLPKKKKNLSKKDINGSDINICELLYVLYITKGKLVLTQYLKNTKPQYIVNK